jgi:hypothetical protein
MKFALTLFAIGLLALGCNKQTAPTQNKLVGTWVFETNNPNGEKFTSTITVGADGLYVGHITSLEHSNTLREFDLEGTWQIKDGVLIDIMTKHSGTTNENLKIGSRAQIIQFNQQQLIVRSLDNSANDGPIAIFKKQTTPPIHK